jgi:hypothetical protein
MQRNRTTKRPVEEHPIVKVSLVLLVLAMGWWFVDGFAERRDIEARQRAAIIRAEGGMSQ